MASFTGTSLRAGKRANDSRGTDDHLSKVVELNGKYRLFFSTSFDQDAGVTDIHAIVQPGRSCNFEIAGTSFVSYTPEMCDINELGDIDDKTGLTAWARIARVLHNACCIKEKKSKEREATEAAEQLRQPVDQVSLQRALDGIELQYHGGKAADGTRISPSINPAISGMQYKTSTRVLVVKLLPDGRPDWKNAKYAVYEISKARMTELIALLDDPNYCDPATGYLEVGYDYIGSDKKTAGKAKFQGIAKTLSLQNLYGQDWTDVGLKMVDEIVPSTLNNPKEIAEFLRGRNRNLRGSAGPNDVVTSMRKWCAENAAVFAFFDYEEDTTKYAAKDFLESHLVDSIPAVKEQLEDLAKTIDAKSGSATASEETAEQQAEPAQTMKETAQDMTTFEEKEKAGLQALNSSLASEETQTLREIMEASSGVDLGDDLGDIDA